MLKSEINKQQTASHQIGMMETTHTGALAAVENITSCCQFWYSCFVCCQANGGF
jgi:hypothetical protein